MPHILAVVCHALGQAVTPSLTRLALALTGNLRLLDAPHNDRSHALLITADVFVPRLLSPVRRRVQYCPPSSLMT